MKNIFLKEKKLIAKDVSVRRREALLKVTEEEIALYSMITTHDVSILNATKLRRFIALSYLFPDSRSISERLNVPISSSKKTEKISLQRDIALTLLDSKKDTTNRLIAIITLVVALIGSGFAVSDHFGDQTWKVSQIKSIKEVTASNEKIKVINEELLKSIKTNENLKSINMEIVKNLKNKKDNENEK
jgi:hypothetical protein